MSRVVCGWCGGTTQPARCAACGRDPLVAWRHRGRDAPTVPDSGRRPLDGAEVRRLYEEARFAVVSAGGLPTIEAIANRLDRSPRTVRAWRQRFGL